MAKFKFKLNSAGVRALLKSEEMQSSLAAEASRIRGRLGAGYRQDAFIGKNRANAMVWAESPAAKRENLKQNTLLKAVRG